ncbi:protein phosphatase CheZ [Desulfohalovibrio reitneri]|uniref:protein phosphatase CheZ n=1 Tax=Desulfohalovibrio reitneri TaxID=1307759 RepID=UPI0004A74047|nr:protein phosphatase CheZ [Desulfohalovibrio reitneri]
MDANEQMVQSLLDKVSDRVVADLRSAIATTVEQEVQRNISRALLEGEFFRHINSEMQDGLKRIYQEINTAKKEGQEQFQAPVSKSETDEIFSETSDQLDRILQTTEEATVQIMDIVEKHLELQAESATLLHQLKDGELDGEGRAKEALESLIQSNQELNQDMMQIMTTLSFQDLTGQRIKRVISALKQVEQITFELFMSTGLKLRAKEENPDVDMNALENETRQRVSKLKGPQNGASQDGVDDLLSQLGLE